MAVTIPKSTPAAGRALQVAHGRARTGAARSGKLRSLERRSSRAAPRRTGTPRARGGRRWGGDAPPHPVLLRAAHARRTPARGHPVGAGCRPGPRRPPARPALRRPPRQPRRASRRAPDGRLGLRPRDALRQGADEGRPRPREGTSEAFSARRLLGHHALRAMGQGIGVAARRGPRGRLASRRARCCRPSRRGTAHPRAARSRLGRPTVRAGAPPRRAGPDLGLPRLVGQRRPAALLGLHEGRPMEPEGRRHDRPPRPRAPRTEPARRKARDDLVDRGPRPGGGAQPPPRPRLPDGIGGPTASVRRG